MFLSDHSVLISKNSSSSPRWLMMSRRIPLTQQSRTNILTSDVPSNTADAIPQTSVQHAGAGRRVWGAEGVNDAGMYRITQADEERKKTSWVQANFSASPPPLCALSAVCGGRRRMIVAFAQPITGCASTTTGGASVLSYCCKSVVKIIEKEKAPQLRKMADVEMDITSRRMNNGNEHV
ncbi:hypothetical protein INR49_012063 [Caranx melampygus]|nr:hypothetical protein INR49_012063 [Caranx melampygus]